VITLDSALETGRTKVPVGLPTNIWFGAGQTLRFSRRRSGEDLRDFILLVIASSKCLRFLFFVDDLIIFQLKYNLRLLLHRF
jgi:hypothetical protein